MEDSFKHSFFYRLLLRWFISAFGLWIASGLVGGIDLENRLTVVIWAGGILAVLNAFVKPVLVVLSVPAILLTLGLFMVVINGAIVYLVSMLYEPFRVTSFISAIITGMVIGLVNYLVTAILES